MPRVTPDYALQQAFEKVLPDAQKAGTWYVVLWQRVSYYGGPEEGGWWGEDVIPVAWKKYASLEAAEEAAEAVKQMAQEMTDEAKRADDAAMARSMDWLEERGLDADFLPEPDGPDSWSVSVSERSPEPSYGPRHYE